MELLLILNANQLRLEIRQKSRVLDPVKLLRSSSAGFDGVDMESAKYYHDISDVLITSLDKLLKRNKLDLKAIKVYKIQGDLGDNSTSYKIASAFVEALKFRVRS